MRVIHKRSGRIASTSRLRMAGTACTASLLWLAMAATQTALAQSPATPADPQMAPQTSSSAAATNHLPSKGAHKGPKRVAQPAQKETQTAIDDYQAGNYPAALSEFKEAADKGNRLAQFNYAMMQLNGEGTPANLPEAEIWLKKAAEANMSHAQYAYGRLFDDGTIERLDPGEAHIWFLKAARQGHMQAQVALANQFMDGRGTPQNFAEAFVWYHKAAESGDMASQYIVATYYERGGDGVTPNLEVARRWYAKAAAQGDPAAMDRYRQLTAQLHPDEAQRGKPAAPTPASATTD